MAAVGRRFGGRIVHAVMRGHGISARSIRRGLEGGGGHGFVFAAAGGIPDGGRQARGFGSKGGGGLLVLKGGEMTTAADGTVGLRRGGRGTHPHSNG